MDPVCYGRAFITNTSDLATLVKCQLGVMEEPKESTDKVSWTVYFINREASTFILSKQIGELFRLINKSEIYLVVSYPRLKVQLSTLLRRID